MNSTRAAGHFSKGVATEYLLVVEANLARVSTRRLQLFRE